MFAPAAVHPKVAYDHHLMTTEDGVQISAQSTGQGPAVLLANGIGVTVPGLDVLPAITCPTLVAAGTDDWVTPPQVGEAMAAAIAGARLLVMPETSHFGVIEHGTDLLDPLDELMALAAAT